MNNDALNDNISRVLDDLGDTLMQYRHATHGHAGLFGHIFAAMLRPYLTGIFETKRGVHDVDAFAILEIMKLARAAARHDPEPSYENAMDAAGYAVLRAAFSPRPDVTSAPAEFPAEPVEPEADKTDPRFMDGYAAGLRDGRLEQEGAATAAEPAEDARLAQISVTLPDVGVSTRRGRKLAMEAMEDGGWGIAQFRAGLGPLTWGNDEWDAVRGYIVARGALTP